MITIPETSAYSDGWDACIRELAAEVYVRGAEGGLRWAAGYATRANRRDHSTTLIEAADRIHELENTPR